MLGTKFILEKNSKLCAMKTYYLITGVTRINVCFSFLVKSCQIGWNFVCFLKINEICSNLVVILKKIV